MKSKTTRKIMWIIIGILAASILIYYIHGGLSLLKTNISDSEAVFDLCNGGNMTICDSLFIGYMSLTMNQVSNYFFMGFIGTLLILIFGLIADNSFLEDRIKKLEKKKKKKVRKPMTYNWAQKAFKQRCMIYTFFGVLGWLLGAVIASDPNKVILAIIISSGGVILIGIGFSWRLLDEIKKVKEMKKK